MIPNFRRNGELPPGVHETTLEEIRERFGFNALRRKLIEGLNAALQNLQMAGVRRVYINGSFITNKAYPADIDGCWDADVQVDKAKLDPVFLDFSSNRRKMKEKFGVDFFISQVTEGNTGVPFAEFFQQNRYGQPKGILLINL